jgi:hypothetical protein
MKNSILLTESNVMFKKFINWFVKPNNSDIVRFIRMEYRNDTEHLFDEDVLAFYTNICKEKKRNVC